MIRELTVTVIVVIVALHTLVLHGGGLTPMLLDDHEALANGYLERAMEFEKRLDDSSADTEEKIEVRKYLNAARQLKREVRKLRV